MENTRIAMLVGFVPCRQPWDLFTEAILEKNIYSMHLLMEMSGVNKCSTIHIYIYI